MGFTSVWVYTLVMARFVLICCWQTKHKKTFFFFFLNKCCGVTPGI